MVALPVDASSTTAFGTRRGRDRGAGRRRRDRVAPRARLPRPEEGEELERKTELPKRAPILAADRSPARRGPGRRPDDRRRRRNRHRRDRRGRTAPSRRSWRRAASPRARPPGPAGSSSPSTRCSPGTPGGELLAAGAGEPRVLASSEPVEGESVRTTIDPKLQDADGRGARQHVRRRRRSSTPKNGNVLALAGLAFSAPQPPGSTFKMITLTGALDAGITKPRRSSRSSASAIVGGREVSNAYDEPCGGNLVRASPKSCNSVFAPLGDELGGEQLVEISERFGFNAPPTPLHGPRRSPRSTRPQSTIPGRPRRQRGGRQRDRPGRGAGDAARDGLRLAGDRQRRASARRPRSSAIPSSPATIRTSR